MALQLESFFQRHLINLLDKLERLCSAVIEVIRRNISPNTKLKHSYQRKKPQDYILFIYFFKFYLFIYLWLRWVLVSVQGLSLVVASGGHSSSRCAGLSPSRPLSLRSTGSRRAGSVIVTHGPSCSAACGIFPDQGSNPCPLALAGRLSTTAPPGKPPQDYILNSLYFFLPILHLSFS